MTQSWLNTNVILRYLLSDRDDHSPRAYALIKGAPARGETLKVAPFVVADLVYILQREGYITTEIYSVLRRLSKLPNMEFVQEEEVFDALLDCRDNNVDFPDALLMAIGRRRNEKVWSFNRHDFKRLAGHWEEPPPVERFQHKEAVSEHGHGNMLMPAPPSALPRKK